jgi:hypothetical protein
MAITSIMVWTKVLQNKSILVPTWRGPERSRRLNLPDFKKIGTWSWQGCQLYAPVVFAANEIFLVRFHFGDWFDPKTIVRPEGLRQWKIPNIPSGNKPSTFRFVVPECALDKSPSEAKFVPTLMTTRNNCQNSVILRSISSITTSVIEKKLIPLVLRDANWPGLDWWQASVMQYWAVYDGRFISVQFHTPQKKSIPTKTFYPP